MGKAHSDAHRGEIILNSRFLRGKMVSKAFNDIFVNGVHSIFNQPARSVLGSPSKNNIFINPTFEMKYSEYFQLYIIVKPAIFRVSR